MILFSNIISILLSGFGHGKLFEEVMFMAEYNL